MNLLRKYLLQIILSFKALVYEKRVPYRFEKLYHDLRYKKNTEKVIGRILDTPPVFLKGGAEVEIRILTNDANACMTILALKSFLRFCSRVKIVVHDDGTLTKGSIALIKKHIVGASVLTLKEADDNFWSFPEVKKLREQAFDYFKYMPITVHKLFDLYSLTSARKMIIMDSDVLFLKEPVEIVDWINNNRMYNLHAQPYLRNLMITDSVLKEKFGNLKIIQKFNSGLLCIRKDIVKFDDILFTLNKLKNDERTPIFGDECVWRFVFSLSESRALSFNTYPLFSRSKYFRKFIKKNGEVGYVHFLLKHKGGFYKEFAAKVIKELM